MGLVVGATTIVTFLMTTLTLNLVDAGAHVTHASASRPETEQPEVSTATRISRPVSSTPLSRPAPSVAQRVAPRTPATKPHVKPTTPQIAASTPPVADPSSFGSEAYEPIYSN
jgi:hypothetical protein